MHRPIGLVGLDFRRLLATALERVAATRQALHPRGRWRRAWDRLAGRGAPSSPLAEWWRAKAPCPICLLIRETERECLRTVLQFGGEPEFVAAFAASAGLCLPHLCAAAAIGEQHPGLAPLLAAHEERWASLVAELDTFARKYDYRYATEAMSDEATSWRRALGTLVGRGGVFGSERPGRGSGGQP